MSMLDIGKICKVSDVAVLKWIRAFSDAISMPTEPAGASMGHRVVLSDAVMMAASKDLCNR